MNTQSRETDITGLLVVVLVVLIGVLIATTTQRFITQKTSTSSRASERKLTLNDIANTSLPGTLSSPLVYGDPKCDAGLAGWFGSCVAIANPQCKNKCDGTTSIPDQTSYGKRICPQEGTSRCLPITSEYTHNVTTLFDLTGTVITSKQCEDKTHTPGAICFNWSGRNVKGLSLDSLNKYDLYMTTPLSIGNVQLNDILAHASPWASNLLKEAVVDTKYKIECPILVLSDVDVVLSHTGNTPLIPQYISSGYCYVPHVTPTP